MVEPTVLIGAPLPAAAWLILRSGRRRGRDFRLGSKTTIGRDAMRCDVILDDESVSGEHAAIRLEGGRFVLYDLASTNGTFLNGEKTQRATLSDGDKILIGKTKMVFKEVKPGDD